MSRKAVSFSQEELRVIIKVIDRLQEIRSLARTECLSSSSVDMFLSNDEEMSYKKVMQRLRLTMDDFENEKH